MVPAGRPYDRRRRSRTIPIGEDEAPSPEGLDVEILSSRTILRPRDYEAALEFYGGKLRLAIAREYPAGTVYFAGQSLIEIAAHGRGDADQTFQGALWLQVRDVYECEAELALAGVPIVREARQEPWGLHELWVADPDGVPIVLVQIPDDHPLRRDSRTPSTGRSNPSGQ